MVTFLVTDIEAYCAEVFPSTGREIRVQIPGLGILFTPSLFFCPLLEEDLILQTKKQAPLLSHSIMSSRI